MSLAVSLLASPAVVAFCQSRSTRLAAVVGALVLALGLLFTSFAKEFPQLYCSFGTVIGEWLSILSWRLDDSHLGMIEKFRTMVCSFTESEQDHVKSVKLEK